MCAAKATDTHPVTGMTADMDQLYASGEGYEFHTFRILPVTLQIHIIRATHTRQSRVMFMFICIYTFKLLQRMHFISAF